MKFLHLHILFSLDTDEELNEWKSKFDERISILESNCRKLSREKTDIEERCRVLADEIAENIKEIATLQAAIEVVFISGSVILSGTLCFIKLSLGNYLLS